MRRRAGFGVVISTGPFGGAQPAEGLRRDAKDVLERPGEAQRVAESGARRDFFDQKTGQVELLGGLIHLSNTYE